MLKLVTSNDNDTQTNSLAMGETREVANMRIHRYRDSIQVTDLAFAGKRGKKVCQVCVGDWSNGGALYDLGESLLACGSFSAALVAIELACEAHPELNHSEDILRGVDVPPTGFTDLTASGKHVTATVTHKGFLVCCLDDRNNEPRLMERGGVKNHAKFREWFMQTRKSLATMTLSDVMRSLQANGIDYHYWCAMD